MADLSELNSSQPVKIAGADSTGLETNFVNATGAGELTASDTFNTAIVCAALSVGTSAVEIKVGASPLTNRKGITIFHNGTGKLYYGCSAVTTASGIQIFKNTEKFISAGSNVHVYLISDTAGQDIRIVEFA